MRLDIPHKDQNYVYSEEYMASVKQYNSSKNTSSDKINHNLNSHNTNFTMSTADTNQGSQGINMAHNSDLSLRNSNSIVTPNGSNQYMISSAISPLSSNNINNNSNTPLKQEALSPLPSTSKLDDSNSQIVQLRKDNKQLRESLKACEERTAEEIRVAMDEANQVRRS